MLDFYHIRLQVVQLKGYEIYTASSSPAGSICPSAAPARTSNRTGAFNLRRAYRGTELSSPELAVRASSAPCTRRDAADARGDAEPTEDDPRGSSSTHRAIRGQSRSTIVQLAMAFSCMALMCTRGFTEHVTATEPKRKLRKMDCIARCVARAALDAVGEGDGDDRGEDDVDVGVCGVAGEA